jgi:MraZ protein
MFRGRFDHSIDDKGRIAIPSRFRDLLSAAGCTTLIVTNYDRCLNAYTLDEWEALEERFSQLPQFDPKVIAFQRFFLSGAAECHLDKSGRINIPNNLRAFAGIERECTIIGSGKKFEFWQKDRFALELQEISASLTETAASISQLGLNF